MERYVQQGKLSVRYEKGKTRPAANFDQTELEAFKTELNQPTIKPAIETRQTSTNFNNGTHISDIKPVNVAEFGELTVRDNKREFTRFGLWELKNYYYHFGKRY